MKTTLKGLGGCPLNPGEFHRSLKKPHFHIMLLIVGKRIVFCPPFLLQIADDMLPGRPARLLPKERNHPPDSFLMMPYLPVPHPISLRPHEFVQPSMDLFMPPPEKPHGFLTVRFKC